MAEHEAKAEPLKVSEEESPWGYDLYPERRGGEPKKASLTEALLFAEGRHPVDKMKCEQRLYNVIKKSPLIKLMLDALRTNGCPVDFSRHIVCESCDKSVTGGYDPRVNQIVICQNTCRYDNLAHGVMVHELIHMFDYCVNKMDFTNLRHLACTEIRAANLTHCSYASAFLEGSIPRTGLRSQHALCVKNKAYNSIRNVRSGVTDEQAKAAIDDVFTRCYNDFEPIGRRVRRGTRDIDLACEEGFLMGYSE